MELCAAPFVLFPTAWMAVAHTHLGLGPFPDAPLTAYLTRSLSALYAVHGAVIVRVSFDVPRFRPLVGFLGWLHVVFGLTTLGIDLAAGMPWFWTAVEGPGVAAGGALVLWLNRGAPAQVP